MDDITEASHAVSSTDFEKANLHTTTRPMEAKPLQTPRLSNLGRSWKHCLFLLLPTFIQSRLRPSRAPPAKQHPTAWLDGMRGLAAFLVVIDHTCYSNHDVYTAWGGDGKRELLRLPLIRFFYTGAAMVAVTYEFDRNRPKMAINIK